MIHSSRRCFIAEERDLRPASAACRSYSSQLSPFLYDRALSDLAGAISSTFGGKEGLATASGLRVRYAEVSRQMAMQLCAVRVSYERGERWPLVERRGRSLALWQQRRVLFTSPHNLRRPMIPR